MAKITLIGLSIVLGYAAFQHAAVTWTDWNVCMLAIGVIAAIHFLITGRNGLTMLDRFTACTGAAVLMCAVLQLVPLPIWLLGVLSPMRLKLAQALSPVTGSFPAYLSLSVRPQETFEYVLTILAYALVFLLIRDIALRATNRWIVLWPVLIAGTLEASLGFYQAYAGAAETTGTYANRDHFAGLLELVLPFAVIYPVAIIRRNSKRFETPVAPAFRACVVIAVAALLLIAIIDSLSRMGFLAALGSIFLVAVFAVSLRGWRDDYRAIVPIWRRTVPVAALAVVVLLGAIYLPTDPLIARFSDLATTGDVSADTRAQIWRDSAGLIRAFPLFGSGLGSYESSFLQFKTVAPMYTVDYAHNDYLQILAEIGVFGFIAGTIFVFRLLLTSTRAAIYARSVDQRCIAIGCVGSVAAILLHSIVDFNMYVPANAFVFSWIAGLAGTQLVSLRPVDSNFLSEIANSSH